MGLSLSNQQIAQELDLNKDDVQAITEQLRGDVGDGFCGVHVNVMEGFWLRPHRGISQEKLPFYLGFFEFVHNVRRRGKALLPALLTLLLLSSLNETHIEPVFLQLFRSVFARRAFPDLSAVAQSPNRVGDCHIAKTCSSQRHF